MSEKLQRAQHIRGRHAHLGPEAGAPRPRGNHAGTDRTQTDRFAPGETGMIPVIGSHAGADRTQAEPLESDQLASIAVESSSAYPADKLDTAAEVGSSAALISICTIVSRITGFARTWAMAFALGATFTSSSYQVANNLPNMLFELVMGGMLATAFLPVYLSVKKKQGKQMSDRYASNLLTIVVLGLGALSLLCMVFPAQVIYTQTFYSNQASMDLSVFFFRFFAIQIVFYGASSIVAGLLNANRDYLWGAIAPVFNNLIVIATFVMYAVVAPHNQVLAFYIIAIGNPLGVFVQMAIQIPALKRNGIRLRPRIDLHDPSLRETIGIGIPAIFVTICSFITVSVANAASYTFADNGPSVIAYSRLWFTFPYSFLAIPVATALFTELSDMQADGNTPGVVRGIIDGSSQIFFLMIPFAFYLVVFAYPLVSLYHVGAFSLDSIGQIAQYLAVMAAALPFYGVNTYLQMAFSSIRKMKAFSVITFLASALQVAIIMAAAGASLAGAPIDIGVIAVGTIAAYLVGDVVLFAYLRKLYGRMGIGRMVRSCISGLALGMLGAAAGALVLFALECAFGALNGSLLQAFAYIVVAGSASLVVTFVPAVKRDLPEAAFVTRIAQKIMQKVKRA